MHLPSEALKQPLKGVDNQQEDSISLVFSGYLQVLFMQKHLLE